MIRSGDWSQIESPNGAAPIPDSQVRPYPPQLIPFLKTRYSRSPPRGTHLHHFSPGYTPGTHKYCAHARTDLLCPCHQFLSRAPNTRYLCIREALKTGSLEKDRRAVLQTVRPSPPGAAHVRTRWTRARPEVALTSSPCCRVTGRHYMKKEIPMVGSTDRSVRRQPPLSLV